MEKKVLVNLKKYSKDSPYIVGVSGGCDSMCLLDILYKNGYNVIVCHVNYGIREDTDIDYQIVYDYCKKNNIPFYYKEVKDYTNDNFQQMARHIRYDFYFETGKIYHTNKVFLGHHKDDVYETILMQKERHGDELYWGIKEVSEVQNNQVYRILLDVTKNEIINYCHQYHIDYHDDYTNFQTHYKRDYVRNVILKKMTQEEKNALELEANRHNQEIKERKEKSTLILNENLINNRLYFKNINSADLEAVIHRYLEIYLPVKRISHTLIQEILKALTSNQPNLKISLPVNLRFIKEYDNGYIQTDIEASDYEYHFSEFNEFECQYFKLALTGHLHEGIYLLPSDYPITIRNFRAGDVVETKFGHKKVNRLFIDNKIPQTLRKSWPILLNKDNEILLIPHIVKNLRYLDTKVNTFVVK